MAYYQTLSPAELDMAYQANLPRVPSVKNETKEKKEKVSSLAKLIKEHLTRHKTYHFRPVKIDGINCYVVIHSKYKIINFESINIKCLITKNNRKKKQAYSLLFVKYKNIEQALYKIEQIVSTYKIYNGDLVSPQSYNQLKLEEVIIPYNEEQVCCICSDNTIDMTLCKHYLCFHCREQCVSTNNTNCPVCRKEEIVNIYNIENGMLNNNSYPILEYAIEYENDNTTEQQSILEDDEDSDDENEQTNNDSDNETIINISVNRDNSGDHQPLLAMDESYNTIHNMHNEIHDHITEAFRILRSNVTVRNREIIEFNNHWGRNLHNDLNYIDENTTIELNFVDSPLEHGELAELNETSNFNETVENKNVV